MDPCSSLLPRESSPLVDPCSSLMPRESSLHANGLEATLDSKDSIPLGSCTTLLSWAAESGREGVYFKLFLSPLFVNPGSIGRLWGTPQAMSVLFRRKYVNPDRPDNYGRTPLVCAARNGDEGVLRLLLGREDVSPDRPDNGGQTPLSWAAQNGCEGVMRPLLEREDVNPDRPDNDSRTPLWWAGMRK